MTLFALHTFPHVADGMAISSGDGRIKMANNENNTIYSKWTSNDDDDEENYDLDRRQSL